MSNMIPAKDVKPDTTVIVEASAPLEVLEVTRNGETVTLFIRVFGGMRPLYLAADDLVELV